MALILKIIYHIINSFRRLFFAIFFRQTQWYVILLGLFIIIIGAFLQNKYSESVKLIGSIFIGIGGSVVASGLVVKILSRDEEQERFMQSGIVFIGDRHAFNEQYHVGSQKGWDAWIRQTPNGSHLIISGKEQRYWLEDSWPAVHSVLERHVETNFIFLGTEEQVEQYHNRFMQRLNEKVGEQSELTGC